MTDFTRKTRTPDPAEKTTNPSSAGQNPGEPPAFSPFDMSGLLDTVEFARNAWLSFGVPSSLTPTMDPEEVDRRIQDLKTVEQWLSMNLNMLKTSIQALELQRSALAAFQGHAWPSTTPGHQGVRRGGPGDMAGTPPPAAETGSPYAWPGPAAGMFPGNFAGTSPEPTPEPDSPAPSASAGERPKTQDSPEPDSAEAAAEKTPADIPGVDPSAWWDLLQRQFQQVTAAVLNPGGTDAEAGAEADEAKADAPRATAQPNKRSASASAAAGKKTATRARKDKTPAARQGKGEVGKGEAARPRTRS